MSDILIKGMAMPSFGNETIIRIQSGGGILDQYGHHLNCEAVPIPPHGRLKDADALIKELTLDDEDGNSGATLLMAIFLEVLKAAPTIIPAEEEK